jgi:UDP-3-O-[3-hydroxymyristoyl] N-acetylglucosamine deacetylase/3-hydroxyacyl-[acyl-carrier-protein] dehydratase
MHQRQRTIGSPGSVAGRGLHTGRQSRVTFRPAPPDSGVVFLVGDRSSPRRIRASIEKVVETLHGTTLEERGARVHSVEHLLAAACGLGIDNLLIELEGNEAPVMDGSALPFASCLEQCGVVEQDARRRPFSPDCPVFLSFEEAEIAVLPDKVLRTSFYIDYNHPALSPQFLSLAVDGRVFLEELAPARTFCLLSWVESLRKSGLIRGGSFENAIVVGDRGILNEEPLRFEDEFVRHKIVDLIGDLALLGRPLTAHVIALKTGHKTHVDLVKELKMAAAGKEAPAFDTAAIQRVMPHRYPFLLVDRILSIEDKRRVVGIKNVTVNEPFFVGHFPGHPIMPGVLIVEAMAQVGGFLLLHIVEEPEKKLVYFVGLDKVKFRRPVVPGDQIRFELEMLRFQGRICRMAGKAYVGGEVVCEAELKASIVDRKE